MGRSVLVRLAALLAAAVFVAGCGQSGVGSAVPPGGSAQARVHRHLGSSGDLVYVEMAHENYILTYPDLSKVTRMDGGGGYVASDPNNGNVLLGNLEYAHGAHIPFARLSLPSGEYIQGNSFDPTTDSMAFTVTKSFVGTWIEVYTDLDSAPTTYYDSAMAGLGALAYDGGGNLFVFAVDSNLHHYLAELRKGSSTFINLPIDGLTIGGDPVWDGQYLVTRSYNTLNRLSISGSVVTVVGQTKLNGALGTPYNEFWIQDGFVIGPHTGPRHHTGQNLGLWKYPDGGNAVKIIKNLAKYKKDPVFAAVVSVPPMT